KALELTTPTEISAVFAPFARCKPAQARCNAGAGAKRWSSGLPLKSLRSLRPSRDANAPRHDAMSWLRYGKINPARKLTQRRRGRPLPPRRPPLRAGGAEALNLDGRVGGGTSLSRSG